MLHLTNYMNVGAGERVIVQLIDMIDVSHVRIYSVETVSIVEAAFLAFDEHQT